MKPHESAATAAEVLNSGAAETPTISRRQVTTDLQVEDLEKHELEGTFEPQSLTPPEAMFRPIDYPPLHIFVRLTGNNCLSTFMRIHDVVSWNCWD